MTWWHPVAGTLAVCLLAPICVAIGMRIAARIAQPHIEPGQLRVIRGGKRAS